MAKPFEKEKPEKGDEKEGPPKGDEGGDDWKDCADFGGGDEKGDGRALRALCANTGTSRGLHGKPPGGPGGLRGCWISSVAEGRGLYCGDFVRLRSTRGRVTEPIS